MRTTTNGSRFPLLPTQQATNDGNVNAKRPTEVEIQDAARAILPWLEDALVKSGDNKDLKRAAKYFLGTCSLFTRDLDIFPGMGARRFPGRAMWRSKVGGGEDMFTQLQAFCKKEALKIGKGLHDYFCKEDLGKKLGSLHEELPILAGFAGQAVRQVGVWERGWRERERERERKKETEEGRKKERKKERKRQTDRQTDR